MSKSLEINSTYQDLFEDEINKTILLCSRINEISSRLKLFHSSNSFLEQNNSKSTRDLLLKMCSIVEISSLSLESWLTIGKPLIDQTVSRKSKHFRYTREELLQRRDSIEFTLSKSIKEKLKQRIEFYLSIQNLSISDKSLNHIRSTILQ